MSSPQRFVGIDVSKDTLDVAIRPDDPKLAELYEQIGRLQVELAFVKKKSPGLG